MTIDDMLDELRTAAPGARNETLNLTAFALFRRVAGGQVDEATATLELEQAAEACGLRPFEYRATINSARVAGYRHPLMDTRMAELSPAEKRRRREQAEKKRAAAEAALRKQRLERAALAAKLYAAMPEARPDCPYLVRKGCMPVPGLRETTAKKTPFSMSLTGRVLVVPLVDERRKIWSLEFIDGNGCKRFLTGGWKKFKFFPIEAASGDRTGPLILAEGVATAMSLAEATGWTTVCCFDAGNIQPVARIARRLYPGRKIVVAADNDHGKSEGKND